MKLCPQTLQYVNEQLDFYEEEYDTHICQQPKRYDHHWEHRRAWLSGVICGLRTIKDIESQANEDTNN